MQQVTSIGGFAYGVINADIHVFANGEPLSPAAIQNSPACASGVTAGRHG